MPETEACLQIEGIAVDYLTHSPLPDVHLFAKLAKGRIKMSVSSASGKFQTKIPCEATAILVEKDGYRSQNLLLNQFNAQADKQIIVTVIPLISIEPQANDRTYLQTEQTDYVQQSNTVITNKTDNSALQHGLFIVTDAILNTPIKAKLCFISTKTGERKCIDTDLNGLLNLDFKQADIVAVEATVPGYQPYAGNLIVESLDGRLVKHNIQLQRALTTLTIQADKAIRCELRSNKKIIPLTEIQGYTGWFNTYQSLPGSYELFVASQTSTYKQAVKIKRGLNYNLVSTDSGKRSLISVASTKSVSRDEVTLPTLILPDSIPMIYFEQGSYQLRPDSQDVLMQVASYLKNHQNYTLQVTGHTDNVGDERLNKSLSEFRAAVTATFLTRQGISDAKLTKAGLGSRHPISPNDTEANKALNRRVSLKLISIQ